MEQLRKSWKQLQGATSDVKERGMPPQHAILFTDESRLVARDCRILDSLRPRHCGHQRLKFRSTRCHTMSVARLKVVSGPGQTWEGCMNLTWLLNSETNLLQLHFRRSADAAACLNYPPQPL